MFMSRICILRIQDYMAGLIAVGASEIHTHFYGNTTSMRVRRWMIFRLLGIETQKVSIRRIKAYNC